LEKIVETIFSIPRLRCRLRVATPGHDFFDTAPSLPAAKSAVFATCVGA
jgi:hypothetical protein